MRNAYSLDLRECVISDVETGGKIKDVVRRYRVGRDTIRRWRNQKKALGHVAAKGVESRGGYKLKTEDLQAHFKAHPDYTLEEAADALSAHPTTVHYSCKRFK